MLIIGLWMVIGLYLAVTAFGQVLIASIELDLPPKYRDWEGAYREMAEWAAWPWIAVRNLGRYWQRWFLSCEGSLL